MKNARFFLSFVLVLTFCSAAHAFTINSFNSKESEEGQPAADPELNNESNQSPASKFGSYKPVSVSPGMTTNTGYGYGSTNSASQTTAFGSSTSSTMQQSMNQGFKLGSSSGGLQSAANASSAAVTYTTTGASAETPAEGASSSTTAGGASASSDFKMGQIMVKSTSSTDSASGSSGTSSQPNVYVS